MLPWAAKRQRGMPRREPVWGGAAPYYLAKLTVDRHARPAQRWAPYVASKGCTGYYDICAQVGKRIYLDSPGLATANGGGRSGLKGLVA